MKKLDFKYKIIIFFVSSVLIFSLLFFSIRDNWNFSFILKDIFYFPITIMDVDKEKINLEGITYEKEKELEELKKLLDITSSLTDFTYINATVINRNTAYWNNELTINKGSNDGIKKGMAVIDGNGLVGTVIKTSLSTSVIKLITNNSNNNKISVKIWNNNESINKVLEQDENNNLIISGIDNNFYIEIGNLITTSGLSDIYPSGITVGKVNKIEHDKFGISKKVIIKPSASLENIRYVSVLLRG